MILVGFSESIAIQSQFFWSHQIHHLGKIDVNWVEWFETLKMALMFSAQQKKIWLHDKKKWKNKKMLYLILRVGRIGVCRCVFTEAAVRRCSSK